ncbi:MAG TPA: hypothetical protein VG759_23795 [Candidatus Angelobacter sp.]|jgi:hypothetical protein|nr:hypothetical protein [Candidatus Angelobacter sp.]
MPKSSVLLTIILLSSLCLKSDSQSRPTVSEIKERRAKVRPILDLAIANGAFRPKLSMQGALKVAENYIDKQHIDISTYWLYRVIYILSGDEKTPDKDKIPGWHFWWVSETGTLGDDVEIFVTMDGKASRVPSM